MKISEFKNIIKNLKKIVFVLSDGNKVPSHFHITKFGVIRKTYIDCGGDLRLENSLNMQLWYSNDKIIKLSLLKS